MRLAGLLDRYAIECDDRPLRTAIAAHSASWQACWGSVVAMSRPIASQSGSASAVSWTGPCAPASVSRRVRLSRSVGERLRMTPSAVPARPVQWQERGRLPDRVDSFLGKPELVRVLALGCSVSHVVAHRSWGRKVCPVPVRWPTRIAQIPGDSLQDQRCLEVPALEIVLGSTPQLLGNRTQDHGGPPNRRGKVDRHV